MEMILGADRIFVNNSCRMLGPGPVPERNSIAGVEGGEK